MTPEPSAASLSSRLRFAASDPSRPAGSTIDVLLREAADEIDRLLEARENLYARLTADPTRAAVATIDGLRTLLAEEDGRIDRILDWIGVADDETLSRADRVRLLAVELATKQGYSLDQAERLAPGAAS